MSEIEKETPKVSPITWKYILINSFVEVFGQLEPFENYRISVENASVVAIRDIYGIKGWMQKTDGSIFSKLEVENVVIKAISSPRNGKQKVSILIYVRDERNAKKVQEAFECNYKYTVHKENPWN